MKTRTLWSSTGFAVAVLALLSVAACGVTSVSIGPGAGGNPTATPIPPTATPTHPAGPVVTAPIASVAMLSATTGWGTVKPPSSTNLASSIAYTVDGGHIWYDVTPSGLTVNQNGHIALDPISSQEAWTWVSYPAGSGPTKLWHSTDAGAHWSLRTVQTGAVMQLDFIDSMNGWLAATLPAYTGHIPIAVWHTTDGGNTWTQVATQPVAGHTTGISFVNATTGFATAGSGATSQLLITVTHNAGINWNTVSLSAPSGIAASERGIQPPVFTSATNGVMVVTYITSDFSEKLVVYHTTDAGATWAMGPVLNSVGVSQASGNLYTSVTASEEVFAASVAGNGSVTLYALLPGASSWMRINTKSGLLTGLTQLDFLDAATGWAVTKSGLIGTTDGGMTWTVLHP